MGLRDPEARSEYNRQYWLDHRDELQDANRKKAKDWYTGNREKGIARAVQHRKDNRESHLAIERRSRQKLKRTTIEALGGQCACCGESELEFLAVDHIAESGAAHRNSLPKGSGAVYRAIRDEGYPRDKYQVLCHNCNYSKYLGKGVCAHARCMSRHDQGKDLSR